MALLGRLDRPREAIAQYDSLREILRSTLGRNPSPETEHLRRSPGAPPPEAPRAPRPVPQQKAALPPLAGRDEERRRVESEQRVLILGEPGIGKSRLLVEAVAVEARKFTLTLMDGKNPTRKTLTTLPAGRLLRATCETESALANQNVPLALTVKAAGTSPVSGNSVMMPLSGLNWPSRPASVNQTLKSGPD